MTNEEIIKGLTKMLNNTIEANECGLSNNDFKYDIELLQSVLSLIKEQEEEIERLKTDNGNVWQLNANMSKRHLEDICKLKQKEKQIDLMADFMYKTGTGRKALSCVFRQNDECNENGCEYCIKRYFAGLVERK